MSFHSEQTAIHRIHNYEYADATERTAATGFVAGDVGKVAFQTDTGSFWALVAITPTWVELTGTVAGAGDFSAVSDNVVPVNSGSMVFVDSGAAVDLTTLVWTFDNTINVPGGSINVGETLRLSEGTSHLIVTDVIDSQMGFSVTSPFIDATGSEIPAYIDFGAPQTVNGQIIDTTVLTANPLDFSIPSGAIAPNLRLVDQVTFRANGPMTNFATRITDQASGAVIAYIPSKAAFEGNEAGLTLIAGDVTFFFASDDADTATEFHLGFVPFIIQEGQIIDIRAIGDTIDLKGDAFGIPYVVFEVHDGPTRELGLADFANRLQTTGILEGGVITQANATEVDWTAGNGQVVDYTDPELPVITEVEWDAVTGYTPADINSDDTTVFGYDSNGDVVEKLLTALTVEDFHSTIFIGAVLHLSSAIDSISAAPQNLAYDGVGSFADFIRLIIGPANISGNDYGANGVNLNLDVIGGTGYWIGSNFRNDPNLSDIVTLPSSSAIDFFKVYRSAAGEDMIYDGAATDTIDSTQYDDGSGTLQSVGANRWTIQRIFRDRTGLTYVAYGQEEFLTQTAALDALGSEAFEEKSPLPAALFRTSLLVQEGATDLSDTDEAEFFAHSSFRITGAVSASTSIPGVTSPGGVDTSVQFNTAGVFGGDSNYTYDTTTKTLSIAAPAAGASTIEFANSSSVVKGTIAYDESADTFSVDVANGLSELHLNQAVEILRGVNDGRLDVEPMSSSGKAILSLSNNAGGTGLQIEHDDPTNDSTIRAEIGNLTISTNGSNEDVLILPTGNVGVGKADPDSVLHVYEDTTESGIQAGLTIEQDGSGDAIAQFLLTGGQRWVAGIDNSGSDAFKIASSLDLGSNAQLVLETDGRSEFLGELGVNILPASPMHVYEDTTTGGAETGLTIEQDGIGDAVAQFLLTGGQRWVMGIDNSITGDPFKIASSEGLASDAELIIDTAGKVGLSVEPVSRLHVYENTSTVGIETGLTIEQEGTGDAILQFLTTGETRWVMGIDNSIDDDFAIARTADLNSNRQLTLQVDGKNYFTGTLGVNKVPDDGYTLDVSATTTQVVGLFSSKAVTIEGRNFGEGNTTDFFFNRGNVGFNQSEFAMFNANTASGGLRHFKMFYSDFNEEVTEIGFSQTRGGNVGIGRDVPSNKFHVQLAPATGTGTVENVTNNVLDGTGTSFLTELRVGGYVFINSEVRTVTSITSDTVAGISSDFTAFPITPAVAFTFNYPTFTLDNSGNAKFGGNGTPTERFQIDTIGSDVVELRSDKAVTLEVGTFGSPDSTDLIFNKGDVGTDQSEFVMLNENNAASLARYFRMSFSDDIGVSGGVTVWKERNNVGIGPYTEPDSVLTVSENTTETGDQAGLTIIQQGSGDAIAQFLLDGGQRWVMGIDNSANDAFKISSSINLGSNDRFVLDPTDGAFIFSNTETGNVLTLGNSTGEISKITVNDAGSPEGAVIGTGGDIHINSDDELSTASLKKSSASSTADWYDFDLVSPLIKVIYNTAEFEAMASGGIITVSSSTTWVFKGHIDSDVRVVFENRATLHIVTGNSNQASWTYSGTGTLLTGVGGLRSLGFMDILSSSTGTFADLDMSGRSMNLTLAGLFNWDDLGSLSNGTFILDVSDIFDNVLGFAMFNMKMTITQSNVTNTPTGATPLFTLDNSFGAKSVNVDQLTGTFNAGASIFRIEPALNDSGKVAIGGVTTVGAEIFDTSGATGDFSAVADAAVPAEVIASVSDSSGVARFNFTAPPTLFVNQEVVISGFVNVLNLHYNGTFVITATAANYFEVATIAFGADEVGSFLSNSVTVTDTGTTLVDGDQVVLDTLESIDYDGGVIIYNQLVNTFQINRTFTITHSGTWSQAGLDQTDPRVLAFNNPDFSDSKYIGFGHIEENPIANTTIVATADTYQAIDITGTTGFVTIFATNGAGGTTCTSAAHGLSENQNIELIGGDAYYEGIYTIFNVVAGTFDIARTFQVTALTSTWNAAFYCDNERFKCTNPVTGEMTYVGNEPFEGSAKVTWSTLKTGSAANYIFSVGKNGISPDQGAAYQKRSVSTAASVHPVTTLINLVSGDTVQPILAGVGTTNDIQVENLQMEIS